MMVDTNGPLDASHRQLGPYQVIRQIGQGAMGNIYLATDTRSGTRVAVKTPSVDSQDGERLLRRFRREARAAEKIRHAHVCRVYETNAESAPYYYAMEWIDGVTLRCWLTDHTPVNIDRAVSLAQEIATGLQAAHDLGILHRDLKSDNVMMRGDEDPVIVDFGLARWFDRIDQSLLTIEGTLVGSPAYMAPEQILAEGNTIGPAADVYSLGVLLYELLTGSPPFVGDGIAVLFKAAHETPANPSQHRPEVDSTLDAIVQKALAKAPEERFATAAEFAAALECHARGEPWSAAIESPCDLGSIDGASSAPPPRRGLSDLLKRFWR